MKRILVIINPKAGTLQAAKYLADICEVFCRAGYETIIATTFGRGDGTTIAKERAKDADIVVAVGGDGTFNEVIAGVMESGVRRPIGYIPAGTTNDFASSLGLSSDLVQAAKDIVSGTPHSIDIGRFNGRYFSYVASFGAFTNTSYDVPQNLKNLLGHTAYILEGAKDLLSIKPSELKLKDEVGVYGGKYIFGAICNSTSMGGILTLSSDVVDMSDGKFEVMLVRMPSNLIELSQELLAISKQQYDDCKLISFFSSGNMEIIADPMMPWTLDGEFQEGARHIKIENVHNAVDILVNEEGSAARRKKK
ncbi:MAG: diacylglycerol/lipid kinase family protein [Eubacterium sp.]